MPLRVTTHPPRHLAAVGLCGFFLLGVIYPVLGPALPRLSEMFGLKATGASVLISANAAGAVMGVLIAGGLSGRLTARTRALVGVSVTALGCLGLAFAPLFALAVPASLLLGLGFGMLDLTLNVWLSTSYGERSAAMLNLLSASFGVGAILAPLAVGWAGGNFKGPLLGCVALAAVLVSMLGSLPRTDPSPLVLPSAPAAPSGRARALLTGFVLLFLAYVAVEGGVGAWEVTHLRGVLDLTVGAASQLSAWFWVSFTVGRLISAPLTLRVAPATLLACTLLLATLSLGLATLPSAAPLAYTLTGLFLAPVFTTGLVWLTQVLPGGAAPTVVFAGAFAGPVLFSPLIGAVQDRGGPGAIPLTLMGITLLDFVIVLMLRRALREPVPSVRQPYQP